MIGILGRLLVSIRSLDSNREWKSDGYETDTFDSPHGGHTDDLYEGEHVHPPRVYVTQVDVVWLIFLRHEDNQNPLDKLERKNRSDV